MKRQFFIYITVGLLSALLDVALLQLLITYGVDYRVATSAGFVVGLVFNYLCHQRITFRSRLSLASTLRYISVVGFNYFITLGLVMATVALWQNPIPGKLLALPIVALIGFFAGRAWIFR